MQTGALAARICPLRKAKRMAFMILFSTFVMILVVFIFKSGDEFPEKRHFNFALILPFVEPKLSPKQRNVFMAVIVNSAAVGEDHRQLRSAIRYTWGRQTSLADDNRTWRLVFVLGLSNNGQCDQVNRIEAKQHNDILVGNFTDQYYNIAMKTFMGHYWALSRLTYQYVLKTDDDVYVRIPQTITWLRDRHFPHPFYGGHVERKGVNVIRHKSSKWYVSKEQYEEDEWPPFCHGAFHILSSDAVPLLIKWSRKRSPLFTDDAYIAVIMQNASIQATQIPGYSCHYNNKRDCSLDAMRATGHHFTAKYIFQLHGFYKDCKLRGRLRWRCSFWIYRNLISKVIPVF